MMTLRSYKMLRGIPRGTAYFRDREYEYIEKRAHQVVEHFIHSADHRGVSRADQVRTSL